VLRDAIANAAPAHAFDSADEFTSLDELPLASPHSRASTAVGAIELLGEYELSPPRPAGLAKRGSRLATRGAIISEDSTGDDESRSASPSPSPSPSRSPRGGGLRSAAAPTFAVESEVAAAAAVHVDSMEDWSERCERCERCELAELVVSVLVEQLKAAQEDAQHRTMQVTLCTDLTRAAGTCEPCTASCASVCVCETCMYAPLSDCEAVRRVRRGPRITHPSSVCLCSYHFSSTCSASTTRRSATIWPTSRPRPNSSCVALLV
jgi:hypothetical protein